MPQPAATPLPRLRRRVVPTRAGWSVVGASAGLFFGAWFLGSLELAVLAVASLTIVLASCAWSATRSMRVLATRTVVPPRVTAGADARAEIEVTNTSTRVSPTYAVTDAFDEGRRAARFLLAPLPHGGSGRGAYRIPTGRRGRFNLGPLAVTAHEPFGFSTCTVRALGVEDVLVRPRTYSFGPLPQSMRATEFGANARAQMAYDADEFFSLRDYVVGDELRRVHWRTSARFGRLMVREDETRREAAAIVLLDTRPEGYAGEVFERALEATASVCARFARDGREVELLSGGTTVLGFDTALDHCAIVQPSPNAEALTDTLRAVTKRRGVFVAVTGDIDRATIDALRTTAQRVGCGVLVHCGFGEPPLSDPSLLVVPAARGDLAAAWNRAVITWTVTASSLASRSPH